jgi:hypothetical protein
MHWQRLTMQVKKCIGRNWDVEGKVEAVDIMEGG